LYNTSSCIDEPLSEREREEKKRKSFNKKFNSPGAPARLDWSMSGCTIRRRALMNLTIAKNQIKLFKFQLF